MKRAPVVVWIVTAVCALASPLAAQTRDEAKLTIQVITEERKSLAMGAMDLTAEQQSALSPIYDAYLKEHGELDAMIRHGIQTFLAKYKAMPDEDAKGLLREVLTVDQMRLDLHKKYTAEFAKVLPPRMVLRLWQIENKLDTIIMAELVKAIPLAR
jgi:hypothetical protein